MSGSALATEPRWRASLPRQLGWVLAVPIVTLRLGLTLADQHSKAPDSAMTKPEARVQSTLGVTFKAAE